MTVVWLIVKIIGWILLGIVSVAAILLAVLLFLPFHYGFKGVFAEEKSADVSVAIHSFLHFWQIDLRREEDGFGAAFYAFWGKCRLFRPKQKKAEEAETPPEEPVREAEAGRMEAPPEEKEPEQTQAPPEEAGQKASDKSEKSKKKKKRKRKIEKPDKEKRRLFHNKEQNAHTRKAVAFLLQKVIRLLQKCRPRELHADLEFSLGDPALTGAATGVLSLCPACYGKKTAIFPDFQSSEIYAKGWIEIKGIVFLFHIVYLIISVMLQEDCRKLLFQ